MDAKRLIERVAQGQSPQESLREIGPSHLADEIAQIRQMLFKASNAIANLTDPHIAGDLRGPLKKAEQLVDQAREILFKIQ